MYQIQQRTETRKEGDSEITEYHYDYVWCQDKINSDHFDNEDMRQNPSNDWPFRTETLSAQNVTIGKFRLNAQQISCLGMNQETIQFEDDGEQAIANTEGTMAEKGFATLVRRGEYFYSSTNDNDDESEHVG